MPVLHLIYLRGCQSSDDWFNDDEEGRRWLWFAAQVAIRLGYRAVVSTEPLEY